MGANVGGGRCAWLPVPCENSAAFGRGCASKAARRRKACRTRDLVPALAKGVRITSEMTEAIPSTPTVEQAEALLGAGQIGHAMPVYAELLRHQPEDPRALKGLAVAYRLVGRTEEAERLLRAAVATSTRDPEVYRNHGVICSELEDVVSAEASLRRAYELKPNNGELAARLAEALLASAKNQEAMSLAEIAVELNPLRSDGWYALATASARLCALGVRERATAELWPRVREEMVRSVGRPRLPTLGTLLLGAPLDIQRELATRQAKDFSRRRYPAPPPPDHGRKKFRIGYISADLWDHSVGLLVAPLIEAHDRDRFEVHAFSLRAVDDPMQARIRRAVDGFHDFSASSDDEAATWIRRVDVDVLVDLGGPTAGARPGIVGRRPSRLQLNYLGYPGTVGAAVADGTITDALRDPPGYEAFYDEPLIRVHRWLGTGGWTLREPPSKAEIGLPSDKLVLGYFSAANRIDEVFMGALASILKEVEDAILWLPEYEEVTRANLRAEVENRGVEPSRLVFTPMPRLSTDCRHRHADLWLDSFSPSGGTGSVLAAWAGVPMVTLAGQRPQDRAGAMIATLAGIPELVTSSSSDYVELAISLARDQRRRTELGARLRQRSGPLFAPDKAARDLEEVFVALAAQPPLIQPPHLFLSSAM